MPLDSRFAFPGAGEFVRMVTDVLEELPETSAQQPIYLDQLALDLPFEISVEETEGALSVGMSPPTQTFETGVMPVWHRLRLTVAVEEMHDHAGEDTANIPNDRLANQVGHGANAESIDEIGQRVTSASPHVSGAAHD